MLHIQKYWTSMKFTFPRCVIIRLSIKFHNSCTVITHYVRETHFCPQMNQNKGRTVHFCPRLCSHNTRHDRSFSRKGREKCVNSLSREDPGSIPTWAKIFFLIFCMKFSSWEWDFQDHQIKEIKFLPSDNIFTFLPSCSAVGQKWKYCPRGRNLYFFYLMILEILHFMP